GVQEISQAMDEQAQRSERVVSSVDDIATISQATADRAENVSAASEEQTASITEVTSSLQSLAAQADTLEDRLNEFRTETTGTAHGEATDAPAGQSD
ncbi:methyl-accepting chemotaxis protein, partial [Halobacterium salinarum]|nr:methyl-accepting chemotaxis protein [Halobacterium salinarum]